MTVLVPIVEGQAEVESVPILLRRLIHDEWHRHEIIIAKPFRVKRLKVVKTNELERSIEIVRSTRSNCRAILLLLDADDDCPKELAPKLLARAKQASAGLPVAVILAKFEFEAWFLGSLESLRGIRGLPNTVMPPPKPEDIRDAKSFLSHQMVGQNYQATDDQAAFTAKFDLRLARQRCPSFNKFVREIETILKQSK